MIMTMRTETRMMTMTAKMTATVASSTVAKSSVELAGIHPAAATVATVATVAGRIPAMPRLLGSPHPPLVPTTLEEP